MPDNKDNKKPNPVNNQGGKEEKKENDGKKGGSLDWLHEAANYEDKNEKKPPKSSGDWMKDGGKIV